jgi:hypothetical protein
MVPPTPTARALASSPSAMSIALVRGITRISHLEVKVASQHAQGGRDSGGGDGRV